MKKLMSNNKSTIQNIGDLSLKIQVYPNQLYALNIKNNI